MSLASDVRPFFIKPAFMCHMSFRIVSCIKYLGATSIQTAIVLLEALMFVFRAVGCPLHSMVTCDLVSILLLSSDTCDLATQHDFQV